MTRELLLLRHAKSSWDDQDLDDFDRPLAGRGRKAAPKMAREMIRRGWLPGLALVSPALRARQTWELVSERFPVAIEALFPAGVYMASPDYVLALLREAPAEIGSLLVVGHNPGLEEFAVALAGSGSDEKACRRMDGKFPTCALARFELDGEWSGLDFAGARLSHFLRPRDLS